MAFNYDLLKDMLRCPKSQSPLVLGENSLICTDGGCRLKFEIRDDIPILNPDDAQELSETDWTAAIENAEIAGEE